VSRSLNLFLSVLAIAIIFPLMLPIFLVLRLTEDGEIFYYQKRKGKNGKEFFLIKLSTMKKDSVQSGLGSITVRGDPRLKFFGHTLRKWKLNELPQIINVLLGDLSIVGPRPLIEGTTGYMAYSKEDMDKIYKNRPGLTGIGSMIFRDEEAILSSVDNPHEFYTNEMAPFKARLELWYAKHKSLKIDLYIIVCTMLLILFPENKMYKFFLPELPKIPQKLNEFLKKAI